MTKLIREAKRIAEEAGLTVAGVVNGGKHIRLECRREQRACGYLTVHLGSRANPRTFAGWRADVRAMARGTYQPGGAGCQ